MEGLISNVWELLTIYGLKVIAAIVVFVVGRWIAKGLTKFVENLMNKRQLDSTIVSFVANMTYVALLVFVILARSRTTGNPDNLIYCGYRCGRPGYRSCVARIFGKFCGRLSDDHFPSVQSW